MSTNQLYLQLQQISTNLPIYFSYCIPWISLVLGLFSMCVLFFKKRQEKNIIIFIFKWQYIINVLYALNMVFNDNTFTVNLFNYNLNIGILDPFCKMHYVSVRFIYCLSPWMQVVNFFFYF